MKISVITPSIREHCLELNRQSLELQTFKDFEWIVCSPFLYWKADKWIIQRSKLPGDFYTYNKALNDLFKTATGEIVVFCNDNQWVPSNALEKLWKHYQDDQHACVTGIGDCYMRVENGIGTDMTWEDVKRYQFTEKPFMVCGLIDFETGMASVPLKAIRQAGGIDETFDRVAAHGEREMMYRITKLGYTLYVDMTIQSLWQKHERYSDKSGSIEDRWNVKFDEGSRLFEDKKLLVDNGQRLKLNYV